MGENDLGLPLYDPRTGGCRDGLHPDRVNQNQGSESTLAFLLSLLELRLSAAQDFIDTEASVAVSLNRAATRRESANAAD